MTKKVFVVNARGEREQFSFQKVLRSAKRAGAPQGVAQGIAKEIEKRAYDGIKTFEIFGQVKERLKREQPQAALRFNLKGAMRGMGPTGFPFEVFVGGIFSKLGFQVLLNQFIRGKCLEHEVDFLARKEGQFKIGECKYHNLAENKVGSAVVLEVEARFRDLKEGFLKKRQEKAEMMIVTNTKFSERAVKYAKCSGIELWGWKYPPGGGLEKLIDTKKLYPITILPSLDKWASRVFSDQKMMLAQDVLSPYAQELLTKKGIKKQHLLRLQKEAELLLGN